MIFNAASLSSVDVDESDAVDAVEDEEDVRVDAGRVYGGLDLEIIGVKADDRDRRRDSLC